MAIPSPDSDSEGPPSRRKTRAQRSLLSDMVVLFMLLLLLLTMIRSESIRFSFASLFVQFVLKDFGFLVLVVFRRANNVGAIFLSIKILFYRGITIIGHILDRDHDGCPPDRRQATKLAALTTNNTYHVHPDRQLPSPPRTTMVPHPNNPNSNTRRGLLLGLCRLYNSAVLCCFDLRT